MTIHSDKKEKRAEAAWEDLAEMTPASFAEEMVSNPESAGETVRTILEDPSFEVSQCAGGSDDTVCVLGTTDDKENPGERRKLAVSLGLIKQADEYLTLMMLQAVRKVADQFDLADEFLSGKADAAVLRIMDRDYLGAGLPRYTLGFRFEDDPQLELDVPKMIIFNGQYMKDKEAGQSDPEKKQKEFDEANG